MITAAAGCCNGESAPQAIMEHISTIKAHQIRSSTESTGHWSHRFGKGIGEGPSPGGIDPRRTYLPCEGQVSLSISALWFPLAFCLLWKVFAFGFCLLADSRDKYHLVC